MTPILAAESVSLTYPGADRPALSAVDLAVRPGECVALLGPNGAGKTTLVNCATGLRRPDAGTVRVGGGDPTQAATRRWIGVMLQDSAFPRHLTVGELVGGAAIRSGRPASAAEPVLAEVGLTEFVKRRAGQLSGGQRQRLQLARALVTEPALLVLDEPTVGLDADARKGFWQRLAARRDAGMAILLTTHLIEEAGAVADRVAVIANGQVVADADPRTIADQLPNRAITATTTLTDHDIAAMDGIDSFSLDAGRLQITTRQSEDLLRVLLDRDRSLSDLRVHGASLEDAVMAISAAPTTPFRDVATSQPNAVTAPTTSSDRETTEVLS